MNNIWVTSDHHFGHKNILKFCPDSRPFNDVGKMNDEIVNRHNSVVKKNDTVYFLGDFGFCSAKQTEDFLQRLNGKKHFIFGNHDKNMRREKFKKYFESMNDYLEINVDNKKIVLFHYPIYEWNGRFRNSFHFYGHTHNKTPKVRAKNCLDVGLDSNNCYPWNIRDLITV